MNRIRKLIQKSVVIVIFATIINVSYFATALAVVSASTLISLANSSRAQTGLGALSSNSQLTSAAFAKANDMLQNQYFAHTSPDGTTPWTFIAASGYDYVYAGENLAIGYTDASELHAAWMASPSHRDNILNPNFREIGIATVSGIFEGAETTIVVQMFGSSDYTQPTSEASSEVTAEASEESPGEQPAEETPQPTPKAFDLVMEKVGFSPNRIFTGEEVTFKAALTGETSEIFYTVGDQKIDLKESVKSERNSKEQTFEKTEKLSKEGEYLVTLTVLDKSGNREIKDLGKLKVEKKVIAKDTEGMTLIGNLKDTISSHWIFYTISSLALITLAAFMIFEKKIKFSQKLTASLAAWKL
ncbi:MAG: hypothetical protein A2Y57_00700 [Candidatus Woykebacteria bacterium RBG_13_40_7b]|uniref:SCP domain-containing protein n=1 Tax=Candidatus Woykebacteria bacterium RBG_13_40_7b TaxID=1802594 RepID=A0A1G1WAB3_9BACT|nr:MAG: hypothetical protein A2Y57_00700 [Candidatus Woykebacteria bacterium RBG_13_40_7b]